MSRQSRDIDREITLLGRHALLGPPGSKGRGNRLDRSAYLILMRLEDQGPMSVTELQDAFGLDQSTLSRQTAAMLRAGAVERIADPAGGLARKFRMTPEGVQRLQADRGEKLTALAKILDGWDDERVALLSALLRQFNEGVERLDGHPWPRD
ncbi:MarR family winged helix-turn-helix transcriptional regulator [Actinocorallia aurea]